MLLWVKDFILGKKVPLRPLALAIIVITIRIRRRHRHHRTFPADNILRALYRQHLQRIPQIAVLIWALGRHRQRRHRAVYLTAALTQWSTLLQGKLLGGKQHCLR